MATVGRLDSYFTSLISDLMEIERVPLTRYQDQRDTISIRRGAYIDLRTKLDDFQGSAQALLSTSLSNVLASGRSVTVSPSQNDTTVLTASASDSAIAGEYTVQVTRLAKAQRRVSVAQSNADQALGLSGTFWLGGGGSASASVTPNSTVAGVDAGAVASSQRELGTGAYIIETRDNDGTLEFRLKDGDGNVVSIADQDSATGGFTSQWQAVAPGMYDTGRGLTVTFGAGGSAGSTEVSYTAAGVGVSISADDSLLDIASAINAAAQPAGREVRASVVGAQLVLTAANTGTAHTMIYTDGVGLGISGVDSQPAEDASFSVNGIGFVTSSNHGLKNIISGVTIDLAADSEGKSATLTVETDMSSARQGVQTLVEKFNSLMSYLSSKTSVTVVNNGSSVSYTRGTLADDFAFSGLRTELLSRFASNAVNPGVYDNLRDIGLKLNDNLQAVIDDADLLENALQNNLDDVKALFDQVMGSFDTRVELFTGSSNGYISRAVESFDDQVTEINETIEQYNLYLTERQANLMQQYGEIQTQLLSMSYMQQVWSSIYTSSVNMLT